MQHSFWHKVPVVRLFIAFASGIGISMFYTFSEWIIAGAAAMAFLALLILPFVFKAYHQKWFSGIAISVLFFCCGIYLHLFQNTMPTDHFTNIMHSKACVIMVGEEPVEKSNSWKLKASVLQCIDSAGKTYRSSGNILVYLAKQDTGTLPGYGAVLIIPSVKIMAVPPPKNPGEFNYKRYLAFHYTYHQVYLKYGEFGVTAFNKGNSLIKQIYTIQHYFTAVLRKYIHSPNEVGVAQALLYGFDDDIDEETVNAYANTGTLHVLAVSGMHVGLILWILSRLLFFMNGNKRSILAKRVIIIICIWIYSALCGLSPSILRASVMFSFVIVAQIADRRSNIYNTLAASCFVLLCVNANMLANVGFQLSYMAVLGIVFLQPLIDQWYVATTWLGKQVWAITSVSIAAQLATCPIGILYFHQFPNCFLFSNLLIIPLTTLIIYACIFLLLLSAWPVAAGIMGYGIRHSILFTNKLVMLVEGVPYAYVNGLQITIVQSIMLYLILLATVFYFRFRSQWLFKLSLSALLFFMVLWGLNNIKQQTQQQLVIYSISNSNAIHLINGKNSTLIIDSNLLHDKQKFKFHLQQHLWQCGLRRVDTILNNNSWKLVKAGNLRMMLSGTNRVNFSTRIDLLVIRNKTDPEVIKKLSPGIVVLGGTVKKKWATAIEHYCREKNIPVHHVLYSGAYQLIL